MQKYLGRLFHVEEGQLISIVGRVNNDPKLIDIELTSVDDIREKSGNVQLKFSVRYDDGLIARNSFENGVGWGAEEIQENLLPFNPSLNPIIKGGIFKVSIFIDTNAFFVSIDEKPFCTFAHRTPLVNIQFLKIAGDVDEVFQVNQKSAQTETWPIVNTNVFEAYAPKQFNPGNVIVITGVPRGNMQGSFNVKFYDGVNKLKTHLTLMAFFDCNQFAANSHREEGCMGEAVVASSFPFAIQEVFKLAIAISNSDFLIAVNGQRIMSIEFRDEIRRLLGSMTGVEIISNKGMNVQVQGVEYLYIRPECEGFESFTNL